MLVIDATVALSACAVEDGFEEFAGEELIAPPLMWSESRSALHELRWRREVDGADAEITRRRLESAPIARRSPARLGEESWRIADQLGWAKTYDAEYLALGVLAGARVVTLDARLRRGAARLGIVIGPDEL